MLASSTANDRLTQFRLQFVGLTLTSQSGKTVDLITSAAMDPQEKSPITEFVHLNGSAEPIAAVSIPQDTYTSAVATIDTANFSCITLNSDGGLDDSLYGYGYVPAAQVSVTLPAPITVSGEAMGVSLNLLVSPSAVYPSCIPGPNPSFSINPTFTLTAVPFSGVPDPPRLTHLEGLIASVSSDSITATSPDGLFWSFGVGGDTHLQGVAEASSLAVGMPVDVDAAIQPDGSLAATRIEVNDIDPTGLTVAQGPITFVYDMGPIISQFGLENQGYLPSTFAFPYDETFSFGDAVFHTSHSLSNLGTLRFPATFSAANMVPGQNVSITTHATAGQGYPVYLPATTVTLMPQTMNGTITAISTDGNFSTYTVALAPYELTNALAVQAAQATLLTNPSTLTVYADGSAETRDTVSPAVGSLLRFNGLLFNDNGVLKLDCAWIDDGVAP